jgi:hypothetical protein
LRVKVSAEEEDPEQKNNRQRNADQPEKCSLAHEYLSY